MSESTEAGRPSTQVLPHELPAALRDAGLANWVREPLDDAVDRRRRIIMPPAAAVIGTPASACKGALLAEAKHDDTVFMMGDNPALPKMPEYKNWQHLVNTTEIKQNDTSLASGSDSKAPPRSVLVFAGSA